MSEKWRNVVVEKREYSLDFIKVVCATIIVFHHYQLAFGVNFANGLNFGGGRFYFGYVVELFFIISGYVSWRSIKSLESKSLLHYFMGKYKRLVPMMALIFLAYFVAERLAIVLQHTDAPVQVVPVIAGVFGVYSGWMTADAPIYNSPTWYIHVLLLCYLIFWLVTRLCVKRKWSPVFVYSLLVILGAIAFYRNINFVCVNPATCRGVCAFFMGLILKFVMDQFKLSEKRWLSIVCATYVVAFVYILICCTQISGEDMRLWAWLVFTFFPALMILFLSKDFKKLFGKIWYLPSAISFETYLWHSPLIVFLRMADGHFNWQLDFHSWKIMIAFALFSWGVGSVMYLIETFLRSHKYRRAEMPHVS